MRAPIGAETFDYVKLWVFINLGRQKPTININIYLQLLINNLRFWKNPFFYLFKVHFRVLKIWCGHSRLQVNENFKRVFRKIAFFKCGGKIIRKRLHGFVSNFNCTFTLTLSSEKRSGFSIWLKLSYFKTIYCQFFF